MRRWSQPEIEFAQRILDQGGYNSDVAFRVSRKFKTGRTVKAVTDAIRHGHLIRRGKLGIKERDEKIIFLRENGGTLQSISEAVRVSTKKVRQVILREIGEIASLPEKKFAEGVLDDPLLADDPIDDIGVLLLDLQANQCRYPVALDPENKRQRFCGQHREMFAGKFTSSYCPEHRGICTRKIECAA